MQDCSEKEEPVLAPPTLPFALHAGTRSRFFFKASLPAPSRVLKKKERRKHVHDKKKKKLIFFKKFFF